MKTPLSAHRAAGAFARIASVAAVLSLSPATAGAQGEVNIYSYREPQLMAPLLKAFTDKTGVRANLIYASQGLEERIAAEGRNSPADVLLTVDVAKMTDAKTMGITQPVNSELIASNIPAPYRDPEGHWFGLSMRARVVYASKDRVKQEAITYEELAEPKWKGKICTRSGQHPYNLGLLAAMIAHHGEAKAEAWVRGLKANLARKPTGGDREQVRDVHAGLCDLAVGNTYYMAAMQNETKNVEQRQWAAAVKILFPNAKDRGTHVNIAGVVLAKNAPNKANGVKLIEFLASDQGQRMYADMVFEYPLKPGLAYADLVKSWGTLKPDALPLTQVANYRKAASEMMDKVNYDAGP